MKIDEIIGKRFKWISPLTGGETFGEIRKIYNYRNENNPMIETIQGNIYPLKECLIYVEDDFKKIELDE